MATMQDFLATMMSLRQAATQKQQFEAELAQREATQKFQRLAIAAELARTMRDPAALTALVGGLGEEVGGTDVMQQMLAGSVPTAETQKASLSARGLANADPATVAAAEGAGLAGLLGTTQTGLALDELTSGAVRGGGVSPNMLNAYLVKTLTGMDPGGLRRSEAMAAAPAELHMRGVERELGDAMTAGETAQINLGHRRAANDELSTDNQYFLGMRGLDIREDELDAEVAARQLKTLQAKMMDPNQLRKEITDIEKLVAERNVNYDQRVRLYASVKAYAAQLAAQGDPSYADWATIDPQEEAKKAYTGKNWQRVGVGAN